MGCSTFVYYIDILFNNNLIFVYYIDILFNNNLICVVIEFLGRKYI